MSSGSQLAAQYFGVSLHTTVLGMPKPTELENPHETG
jgi:hypothetical protein